MIETNLRKWRLDLWMFRAKCYFNIHKLSNTEKMIVVMISFDDKDFAWFGLDGTMDGNPSKTGKI